MKHNHHKRKTTKRRKLLRIAKVSEITGLSKPYIYQLSKSGLFPNSIELVPGGTSRAWIEDEIYDWNEQRIETAKNK